MDTRLLTPPVGHPDGTPRRPTPRCPHCGGTIVRSLDGAYVTVSCNRLRPVRDRPILAQPPGLPSQDPAPDRRERPRGGALVIYSVVIYLIDLAAGRSSELFFATVVACGLITFYSMPDVVPYMVRIATMVAVQIAVGRALQREKTSSPSGP